MIAVLVPLGQVFELRAREQTSGAIRALLDLAPKDVHRLTDDGTEEEVTLDLAQLGDRLRVRPGEKVPAGEPMMDLGQDRALYSISVTSELTGVNPQMLRSYETKGLLTPFRTEGGIRRYSGQDVDRIEEIMSLLAAGLNLAGVRHVLGLLSETQRLQAEIDRRREKARRRTPPVRPSAG